MSQVIHVNSNSIEALLARPGIILVDFWAPWCGPCVAIGPILDALASKMPQICIAKINVDDEGDLAARYQVRSIPTLLLFRDGQLISTKIGALTASQLEAWLAENGA